MRNNKSLLLLFVVFFSFAYQSMAQCSSIFNKGISYMAKKQYKSAIKAFEAAKVCDKNLAKSCDAKIATCYSLLNKSQKKHNEVPTKKSGFSVLELEKDNLYIEAMPHNKEIVKIKSTPEIWKATSNQEWCKVSHYDAKSMSIQCNTNSSTDERTAEITVTNIDHTKKIILKQKGIEEVLEFLTKEDIVLKRKGETLVINLKTNTSWDIIEYPDWITLGPMDKDQITITAQKTKKSRTGSLIIQSKSKKKIASIIISQTSKLF